jgi:tRNA(His) 5'-end guanylyltransferase
MKTMQETMLYLCKNIQGCVLGYTQSDEITLILVDYQKLDTSAWFDYEVEKICSVAASMATMEFNRKFAYNIREFQVNEERDNFGCLKDVNLFELRRTYEKAAAKGALFDCRVFNIPKEEVTNLIYWRQLDAARNSVQMVGQAYFSHNELHKKTCSMIQDMLHEKYNINWNNYPTDCKRGSCCVKNSIKNNIVIDNEGCLTEEIELRDPSQPVNAWIIDREIPLFKGEGRDYIEKLINFNYQKVD